jgi:precorrin-8X/cobalt-precorrin-8 methylmutase
MLAYVKDPAEIYRLSFETIRQEASLDRLPEDVAGIALRVIHACGMPDIIDHLAFTRDVAAAGRAALRRGAPILCDTGMTAAGVMRRHLPAANEILAGTDNPDTVAHANMIANTRSAAAVDLWGE